MKMLNRILYAGILCLALNACSNSHKKKEISEAKSGSESYAADSAAPDMLANDLSSPLSRPDEKIKENGFISSSAAKETGKDTTRKFIRTADVKFRVKSVINATYAIEDIAAKNNGFVTYTNLTSGIYNTSTIAISADSSLESVFYNVENTITVRAPNTLLDTTLKQIAKQILYLDYRTIKAEDVALQILSNKLTKARVQKHEKRLIEAIEKRGKKLNETTIAEENLLEKQEQADNAHISNLSLQDQINYSTINIIIYQRQTVSREVVANEKNTKAYEPSFGVKLRDALYDGWNILEALLLFIARIWGLILFGVVIFILFRLLRYKVKVK